MRYLIKYTKSADIKFISHLDLMRTIQRVIRRAKLPVEYSKGFNPHMSLSIAQPLSVGVYSEGEYMDVVMNENIDESEIVKVLNENTVDTIKFLSARRVVVPEGRKIPQAMALIDAAEYVIRFKLCDGAKVDFNDVLDIKEWNMIKKTKSGEKEVDIRGLVKSIEAKEEDGYLIVRTVIACGSRENLSASLLCDFIKENLDSINKESFVDIKRVDMFALKDDKLVSLDEYFA